MHEKDKWLINDDEMGFMKAFCIHGFKISDAIPIALRYKDDVVSVTFVPYIEFINNYNKENFINNEDIVPCDVIALVRTCNHNTIEMQILKTVIVCVYFAERLKQSILLLDKSKMENEYLDSTKFFWHDFLANYHIDGYKTAERNINSSSWYVNIGCRALDEDDFERWSTRIYGEHLLESYYSKASMPLIGASKIWCDKTFFQALGKIMLKVNSDTVYGRKLRAVFRLYFEILCDYKNIDYTIIAYCTIFETLLLEKDEDSQRKKVSVRAACLSCDGLSFKYKRYVADYVYHFYRYRNLIIHDGKGLMDIEGELLLYRSIWCMKSVLFCIIKRIVVDEIQSHAELMRIVEENVQKDGLEKGFDYIDLTKFENPNYLMPIVID